MAKKNYLVTGAAGFIGFHLSRRLLERGDQVVGVDNLNDYYSPALKEARLGELEKFTKFRFHKCDIADRIGLDGVFSEGPYDVVLHMAAQAGVRYSIENPHVYADSNLVGFLNILEACRHHQVNHLVYASSSSVYGGNRKQPFSVDDPVNHPVSLYAATKRANELMAHTYGHLYSFYTTGIRFFTVYGPWGRPDMAIFHFADSILLGKPIRVFNHGQMKRDFTFIDDVANAVLRLADKDPSLSAGAADDFSAGSPWSRVHNLGSNNPVELQLMISTLEKELGKEAVREYVEMQPGDVKETYADTSDLKQAIGYAPSTSIQEGISQFVKWYLWYHQSDRSNPLPELPDVQPAAPAPAN